MASTIYLENFLETIELLPKDLQRNFTLMKDLDGRTQDTIVEIEECVRDYKRGVANLPQDERKVKLNKIDDLYQKAKEYSDDKVQLAMQMYEMVDKHIRRLDNDLGRFEQELQSKDMTQRRASVSNGNGQMSTTPKNRKRENTNGASSLNKRRHESLSDEGGVVDPIDSPTTDTTDVLDMPVDPNEPTYCLCHQVSFGEMIGCDNPDCPIEWFHFQCVGLTSKPKGKWFCSRCAQERERHKKK
jgi:hypothetical protein